MNILFALSKREFLRLSKVGLKEYLIDFTEEKFDRILSRCDFLSFGSIGSDFCLSAKRISCCYF